MIVIFTTFHKKTDARKIGKGLFKQRLIASYSLFPAESAWWWKGKVLDDKGTLMILKTKQVNFEKIENFIKKHSGYEIPEVIAIKADKVNLPYLNWVHSETT